MIFDRRIGCESLMFLEATIMKLGTISMHPLTDFQKKVLLHLIKQAEWVLHGDNPTDILTHKMTQEEAKNIWIMPPDNSTEQRAWCKGYHRRDIGYTNTLRYRHMMAQADLMLILVTNASPAINKFHWSIFEARKKTKGHTLVCTPNSFDFSPNCKILNNYGLQEFVIPS
jgi:hypothetical protein